MGIFDCGLWILDWKKLISISNPRSKIQDFSFGVRQLAAAENNL